MSYSDFDYYKQTFLGIEIAEDDYPRLALRASESIDRLTFGRASSDTDNTDAIKSAECAIAEEIQRIEKSGADGISSESIGSASVSYNDNSSRSKSADERIAIVASKYLGPTGLIYQGFKASEYSGR